MGGVYQSAPAVSLSAIGALGEVVYRPRASAMDPARPFPEDLPPLRVAVVGLGYVGCVVAASLAARGMHVVGVDLRPDVVAAMDRGIAPIAEPGLAERIARAHARHTLVATMDLATAVRDAEVSLVCVGTPTAPDGTLDESQVLFACTAIAKARAHATTEHTIVIRSTVPPGLFARALRRVTDVAGGAVGVHLGLALNPEFLREGAAVRDLEAPEMVVYATEHDLAARAIQRLYADQSDRLVRTSPPTAEVLKLVSNVWHALKVSFANEVARIAEPTAVDAYAVMDLLCRDRRLNTSAAYLRPGLPFGGACLVKDVSALAAHARTHDLATPVIANILASNDAHLAHALRAIRRFDPRRVAVVGVGFKPGATDVRDSAPVRVVIALLDAGLEVAVADTAMLGATVPPLGLAALQHALGDARAEAVSDVADAVRGADVIVAAHPSLEDGRALRELAPHAPVLDLAGELTRALAGDVGALRILDVLAGTTR